ncbi:MAG: hypothetical protein HYY09_07970 [Firmicutes bacterium]|nr:hypothetical protein [Bacillota bacterium]
MEKDVTDPETARELIEGLGYATTPVTLINGEEVIGFDRRRLESLLARFSL